MKKIIIPALLIILATSCTNNIAEDAINEEVSTTLTIEQARAKYQKYDLGLSCGKYLLFMSTNCDDLVIPEDLRIALAHDINNIETIIKAIQALETQLVFGDTLAEDDKYYDGWVTFCNLNNIPLYYSED